MEMSGGAEVRVRMRVGAMVSVEVKVDVRMEVRVEVGVGDVREVKGMVGGKAIEAEVSRRHTRVVARRSLSQVHLVCESVRVRGPWDVG